MINHQCLDTSYSWSTNVFGVKTWHLFPPSVSHHLRRFPDSSTSEIVFDVRDVDASVFKDFHRAQAKMITVRQPPGWTIFVFVFKCSSDFSLLTHAACQHSPSGWYHQGISDCPFHLPTLKFKDILVVNETDAISINHNWYDVVFTYT